VTQSTQGLATQASGAFAGLLNAPQPMAALPAPAPTSPAVSLSIIRAMMAAAKADGHMDAAESEKIMGQLEAAGASAQEKMLLMQEINNPTDVQTIAAAASTPQEAAQIYLAALLVCDSQCAAEQAYLAELASALKLDAAFTAGLQQELLQLSTQKAA
jgi:uncharacterized membrane protein YebE (DUF533 family)